MGMVACGLAMAALAGKLADDGPATVAGVELPAGTPCGNHWTLDEATPRGVSMARHLATAFPQTGLWRVLWSFEDDPDAYPLSGSDPAQADGLNVHDVLEKVWNAPLPPLAQRSKGAPPLDPFGRLGDGSYVLILVPVNRPADVSSVLGVSQSEEISDAQATAVLRPWEDRFGAVVTEIGPGKAGLSVGSPPTRNDQALRLANEQMVFAPDQTAPDETAAVARGLLTSDLWRFGWPD